MTRNLCPYCGINMVTIETPLLSQWQGIEMDICFNDRCSYFTESWRVLHEQGAIGGYRYFSIKDGPSGAMAVGTLEAYKDCIVTVEKKMQRRKDLEKKELEYMQLVKTIKELKGLAASSSGAQREYNIQMVEWLEEIKKSKFSYK